MSTNPTTPTTPTPATDEVALRKALASTSRPPPASAASAALTYGWRGMLKVKHVPEQLLDVTITPVMFVLMFTYIFGGAIAGSTGEYLDYILPGILVMSVLFTTVYSGVAVNTDLTKGWSTASGRCRSGGRRRSSAPCSVTASATWSPGP